jgi:uncharacterized membrane protein YbhN (UPF0104 family)
MPVSHQGTIHFSPGLLTDGHFARQACTVFTRLALWQGPPARYQLVTRAVAIPEHIAALSNALPFQQ